jgi:hypothetical protein
MCGNVYDKQEWGLPVCWKPFFWVSSTLLLVVAIGMCKRIKRQFGCLLLFVLATFISVITVGEQETVLMGQYGDCAVLHAESGSYPNSLVGSTH